MKVIIFAGGTGKRFWPVSRINSPKQFSPLIAGKPLLRLSIERLLKGFNPEDIFISTGQKYKKEVFEIAKDIPKENIILEPEMRDTGPAVTLAVTYVHEKYPNENICIQWSDCLIKDETVFLTALKEGEKYLEENNKTVFITVPARFPSPHRGYIKFSTDIKKISNSIDFKKFEAFIEKPDVETAKQYLKESTYSWNPGYWILNPEFYISTVAKADPYIVKVCREIVNNNFSKVACDNFAQLEKISADYLFAENVEEKDAVVLLADIGWSDVGEWVSLKEALQENDEANVIKGEVKDLDSTDSIIYNLDDSRLLATIGLKGMVVVNTKDAIAVFPKEDNSRIKEFLKQLEDEGKTKYL